ncbi:hypothetical protein LCGC14_1792450 [marine sediment metagenome]|uniref:Uncharacterized protein n=1 Tax=marine sediment metagenome TaxID=412755 RepID=A0A0F9GS53_9ZZZZ
MDQDLFDFDPEEKKYSWNWWDPWPEGLPRRTQYLWQIRRDLRALEEIDNVDEIPFYLGRIERFSEALKKLG